MGPPRSSHRPGPKSASRRSRRAAASIAASKRWHKGQDQDTESSRPLAGKELVGSRVMDLGNLASDINRISEHSATCEGVCQLVQEVRREGLASILLVQCDKCGEEMCMESSTKVKVH